jgi:hypothetical protein
MPRRRFADAAGYTHHCWECEHAKGWCRHKTSIDGNTATCELTGATVGKYDSPNNPCSRIPDGCDWSES